MLRSPRLRAQTCVDIGLIAFVLLSLSRHAFCRLMSIPSLKELTADSNLIAVVEVTGVRPLGTVTFTDSQGNPLEGQRMAAAFHLEEIVKGQNDSNSIEVKYDFNRDSLMNSGPITPDFLPGTRLIVFLQCSAQECSITDSKNAGFLVARKIAPVPEPPETSPYYRVLQRFAAGLFRDGDTPSDNLPANGIPHELFQLGFEHDPYANTLLHAALDRLDQKSDFAFRGELLAALVRDGDATVLSQLEEALFAGDPSVASNTRCNMVLALQAIDWHQSLPIAARALQSPFAGLRVQAAYIIKFLRTEPPDGKAQATEMKTQATQALMTALHDPDPDVAFAVMQSLGGLNGRLDQRPTSTKLDAQWNSCLHFWETFPNSLPE
jgi:hypothetical protein